MALDGPETLYTNTFIEGLVSIYLQQNTTLENIS